MSSERIIDPVMTGTLIGAIMGASGAHNFLTSEVSRQRSLLLSPLLGFSIYGGAAVGEFLGRSQFGEGFQKLCMATFGVVGIGYPAYRLIQDYRRNDEDEDEDE